MTEFIEDQYDYHQIHRPEILTVLKWAIKNTPTDEYMMEWLHAFKQIYSVQIIYGEHFLENNITFQTTLYGVTRQLLRQIKTINRLAKLRNHAIQARRNERVALGLPPPPPPERPAEIETIHGPVQVHSEFQPMFLPLSNPALLTVANLFEFGDMTIDALTERISHTIDEWNHANP